MQNDDEILDVKAAASFLKCSESWLYRAAAAGDVPSFRMGNARRFRRGTLREWIAKKEREEANRNNVIALGAVR